MTKIGLAVGALALSVTACASTGSTSNAGLGAAAGAGIAAATGESVLVGAAAGGAVGAGAGALLSDREKTRGDTVDGVCSHADLAVGAPVAGRAGGTWADQDRNGCVDGYIQDGQYVQIS